MRHGCVFVVFIVWSACLLLGRDVWPAEKELSPGQRFYGNISAGDLDTFSFSCMAHGLVTITIRPYGRSTFSASSANISLTDPTGNPIDLSPATWRRGGMTLRNYEVNLTGVYELSINTDGSTEGLYSLQVGMRLPRAAFVETGSSRASGEITVGNPTETYTFDAIAGARVVLDARYVNKRGSPRLDPLLRLYDGNGNLLAENDNQSTRSTNARIEYTIQDTGTFRVEVSGAGGSTGAFKLSYRRRDPRAGEPLYEPILKGMRPNATGTGVTVAISGKGFSPIPADNTIAFTGATTTASDVVRGRQLVVTIPAAAKSGPVIVIVNGERSNALNFLNTRFVRKVGATPRDTTVVAGAAVDIFGTLLDAQGNMVPAEDPHEVAFAIQSGTGTFIAGPVLDNGNVRITYRTATSPETATIALVENVSGRSRRATAKIRSTAGSVAKVVISPSNVTDVQVGESVTLTAELQDSNGNMVKATSTHDVTFSIVNGTGTLGTAKLVAGRVQTTYTTGTVPEQAVVRVAETVSGGSASADATISSVDTKGPKIVCARFLDVNGNGDVDQNDQIILEFDEEIVVVDPTKISPSDFFLPVTNDSLGTNAQFAMGTLPTELIIALGENPALTIQGVFKMAHRSAGDPSGIDISANISPGVIRDLSGNTAISNGSPNANDTALDISSIIFADGSAQLPQITPDSRDVLFCDINLDGDADVFFANYRQPGALLTNDGFASGSFVDESATRLPASSYDYQSAAAADIDLDGDCDVVLTVANGQNRLLLNNGGSQQGTVGTFTDGTAAHMPFDVAESTKVLACDFDLDGDPDLFIVNSNGSDKLYVNQGGDQSGTRGVFAPGGSVPSRIVAKYGATAVDVDNDGDDDVVIACYNTNPLLFVNSGGAQSGLRGNFYDGTGGRLPYIRMNANSVIAGDVDNDGDADLLFCVNGQNRLFVNLGGAQQGILGQFSDRTSTSFPTDTDNTKDAVFLDVDYDGDLDVVLANYGAQNRLYINQGGAQKGSIGVFKDATAGNLPPDANHSVALAVADVDRDGRFDVVVANASERPQLYLSRFMLSAPRYVDTTAQSIGQTYLNGRSGVALDIENDGDLDICVPRMVDKDLLLVNQGNVQAGTMANFVDRAQTRTPYGSTAATKVLAFDTDQDGDTDLMLGQYPGLALLYANNGLGIFADFTLTRMPGQSYDMRDMKCADFDRDSDLDVITALGLVQPDRMLVNQGHSQLGALGTFREAFGGCLPDQDYQKNSQGVEVADLDNDGDMDIVYANQGYQNRVWLNMGAAQGGVFGCFVDYTSAVFPVDLMNSTCVVAGDVDNDGDNDIIFGNSRAVAHIYINNGGRQGGVLGTFTDDTAARMPAVSTDPLRIALVDFDRDGDLDLFFANKNARARVFVNQGGRQGGTLGYFHDETATYLPETPVGEYDLVFGDFDLDGDLDISCVSPLQLTIWKQEQ